MVKFIGFTVIILGTTLIGYKQAERIKGRHNNLLYLDKVLIMLKGEIDYNESEINSIFNELQTKTKGSFKKFFNRLYDNTKGEYNQPLKIYWEEAVDCCLKDLDFTSEDINRIKEFSDNLGYLDKNMQLKNIEYLLDYVRRTTNEIGSNMDKSIKMCKMFGVLAGIFITIVLC